MPTTLNAPPEVAEVVVPPSLETGEVVKVSRFEMLKSMYPDTDLWRQNFYDENGLAHEIG
tara:strand:- start:2970 stop:3149 length:180 start_codon:yes stop_codon:yes gene_type:complete